MDFDKINSDMDMEMARKLFNLGENENCSENLKKCLCEISQLLNERECTPYDIKDEVMLIVKKWVDDEYELAPIGVYVVEPISETEDIKTNHIFAYQKINR